MLQAGADVNAASAVHGHTPLDVAIQQRQQFGHGSGIVELLTAKGGQRTAEAAVEDAQEQEL
jgi:hypothetical protein